MESHITDEELGDLFVMTHRMMHRHYMRNRDGECGINPRQGQGRILALLKHNPESGMTQKELAQKLNMRQQSMGEFLGKLEKNGYLTRSPSKEDRRTMIIELTEKGRAFHFEAEPPEKLYGCLSQPEKDQLGRNLSTLTRRLGELLQEDGDSDWQQDFLKCRGPEARLLQKMKDESVQKETSFDGETQRGSST